ncbi:hillarin-like isoform X2 [Argopecten irradians]|uniref:hillarin-like isoform X2 n=1 Tax=Argopecten irradians TaxID=31199 RepID=UPI003722765C
MGNASGSTNNTTTPAKKLTPTRREGKSTMPRGKASTPGGTRTTTRRNDNSGDKEEDIRYYGNTPSWSGRFHRAYLYPFFKYHPRPRRFRDHRFTVKTATTVSDVFPEQNYPKPLVADDEDEDIDDVPRSEAEIYDRARNAPATINDSYRHLMDYLLKGAELTKQPDLIKIRTVIIWLSRQDVTSPLPGKADYDTPANGIVKLSNDTQFEYSKFLSILYEKAGIKSVEISGEFKPLSYDPKDKRNCVETSWNAVFLDGRWQLIMPYFVCTRRKNLWLTSEPMINGVSKDDEKGHVFNYFYFLMDPRQSINWFFPAEPKWQLIKRPLQKEEFLDLPVYRSEFFELGLKLESENSYHLHSEEGRVRIDISSTEELSDEIYLWFDIALHTIHGKHSPVTQKLTIHDNLQKLVAMIKQKHNWMFQMTLPIEGEYKVTIYGSVNGDDFGPIIKFQLHCDKRFDKCSMFPEDPKEVGFGPGLAAKDGGLLFPSRSNGFYPVRQQSVFRLSYVIDKDVVENIQVTCTLAQTEETKVKEYNDGIHCTVDRQRQCVDVQVTIPGEGVFMLSIWTSLQRTTKTSISKLACCYLLITNPDIPPTIETRKQREARENLRQALEAGTLDGMESAITKCVYQQIPLEDEEIEHANTRSEILRLSRDIRFTLEYRKLANVRRMLSQVAQSRYAHYFREEISDLQELKEKLKWKQKYI